MPRAQADTEAGVPLRVACLVSSRGRDEGHEPNVLLRIAAGLYGAGMLILLSPVISDVAYDGHVSQDVSSVCGLTLTSAFVMPAQGDPRRERRADCAAQANDRVGDGALALAVAVPLTVAASARRPDGHR